jgi:AraC-like DNA-binding protein
MPAHDQFHFTAYPGLDGVHLVRSAGPVPTSSRHSHRSLCVGAVLYGERVLAVAGGEIRVAAGQVMALAPGLVHACPDAGANETVVICVSAGQLDRLGFHTACLGRVEPCLDDPDLFGRVTGLAGLAGDIASGLERDGALQALLARLEEVARAWSDSAVGGESRPESVEAAARHLEAHATEEVRLDHLARLVGMSPCRLNRLFSHHIGMPPHEYQILLRVHAVKTAIGSGMGLAEASAQAGFFDQSHMTRCFRKVMGMTPGMYARGVSRP